MRIAIIRLLYRFADPIRKLYWFIFRPTRRGVKCLIEYEAKFLFIRNSYRSKKWTIPGGGVKRKESLEAAAARETLEEVGIPIENLIKIGAYTQSKEYKHDNISIFYAKAQNLKFRIDPGEIEEARWMTFDEVPEPRGSAIPTVRSFYINSSKT